MSFDLQFYTTQQTGPTQEQVGGAITDVLGGGAKAGRSPAGTAEWLCQSPQTGVAFRFRYTDPAAGDGRTAATEDGAPGRSSGLSVEVPYVRPRFVGIESLAAAGAVAGRLGLLMPDPRKPVKEGETVSILKTEPTVMNLAIENWMTGNRFAIASTHRLTGKRPPFLDPERSMYWWRFQRMRPAVQQAVGRNAVVAQARVVRVASSGELVLMADWANGFPAVFPQVEIFLLIDAKSMDDPNARAAWTPAAEVIDKLGPAFRRFEQPGCDLMACSGIAPDSPLRAAFEALPRFPLQGMIEDVGLGFIDEPEQPADATP